MTTGAFFQEQILGMKWLDALIGSGLRALGLDTASHRSGSIHFFLYDVIKITIQIVKKSVAEKRN